MQTGFHGVVHDAWPPQVFHLKPPFHKQPLPSPLASLSHTEPCEPQVCSSALQIVVMASHCESVRATEGDGHSAF